MSYKKSINQTHKAFTLIELLVVIAIIGILSTLVVVALGNSRTSARDAKRLNDLKAMANALELYFADNNSYPASITPGQPLEQGGVVYMSKVPNNPTPRTDGDCPDSEYSYVVNLNGASYAIGFCLGSDIGSLKAGIHTASPQGGIGNSGLIGWWQFNEGSGSTAFDTSGNERHGTINIDTQSLWSTDTPSGNGHSLLFSGNVSESVNVGLIPMGGLTEVSILAWIKWNGNHSGGYSGIFWNGNGHDPGRIMVNGAGSSRPLYLQNSSIGGTNTSGSVINTNEWMLIGYTYSQAEGKQRLYVNGVQVLEANRTTPFQSSANPIRIGWGHSTTYMFNGHISEFRIYQRVVTTEEQESIYTLGLID
ncbi:MAG: prepilin-type N-terminal cleavage/methylation domain-containing protein [Patescibacteria group bacterium]|nr:MAG: prepilin-type N-terminal cleavage/methylation domain-containing protein [Patescibacteria group bacterium]